MPKRIPFKGADNVVGKNYTECSHCQHHMVPRVIFGEGVPTHSICPFCGALYQDFTPENPNTFFKVFMRGVVGLLNSEQTAVRWTSRLVGVAIIIVVPFFRSAPSWIVLISIILLVFFGITGRRTSSAKRLAKDISDSSKKKSP